jgi:hypothetical protein
MFFANVVFYVIGSIPEGLPGFPVSTSQNGSKNEGVVFDFLNKPAIIAQARHFVLAA